MNNIELESISSEETTNSMDSSEWIEWKEGECPVSPDIAVNVKYRNGVF